MSGTMIDFHAHILPGADHGSNSVETSLWQLQQAESVGIEIVVATPHFYPDHNHGVNGFLARRDHAVTELSYAYSGNIQIRPAAEVLLCEGLQNLPDLQKLCIGGTRTLLVEMPMMPWTRRLEETLTSLERDVHLNVVLAHIDRYPAQQVDHLLAQGFRAQLNAEGLCRHIGRKRLIDLADTPSVVAVGSDIHGREAAYQKFERAVRLLKSPESVMERTCSLL